jgi:oligogalacturonide lyase
MNEVSSYRDRASGVTVTQLTNYRGHSHHFYFTNPGWYAGGRKLLFASDRCNRTNLYGLDLQDGEIEQLTDLEPVALPRELEFVRACKNPLREEACFWHDLELLAVDLETRQTRVLCQIEPRWCVSQTNASADGRYIYFGVWEDLSARFEVDLLRGYVGFEETWAAKPLSQVLRAPVEGGAAEVVFEERSWIGHVNTSPTQAELLTICHEGPWGKVDQRIWGLDAANGRAWKIRPTGPGEVVGHEYWYADGLRVGYHGHLAGRRILGRARWDGSEVSEAAFPGETGHIFSNDEGLIVGDGAGVIRLWKWDGSRYRGPRLLCRHDSAMQIQQTHPHPRISPDGRYVIFTSDRSGYGNIYKVDLPEDFESLPEIKEQP